MPPTTNLMSLDRVSMESMFSDMGEKRFHARQVLRWIYQRQVTSPDAMTDLAKSLRKRLNEDADIVFPEVVNAQQVRGRHGEMAAQADGRQLHRDRFYPGRVARHVVRVVPGGLRPEL